MPGARCSTYRGRVIETPIATTLWDTHPRPRLHPGDTPAAYSPEWYQLPDTVDSGEGTERRALTDREGRRRNVQFPALPEPLPHPVVDNHTHLDMQDGLVRVSVMDAMDAARSASVLGLVQAGCDVESSRFAVSAAQSVPGVLAAVALHPNEAPKLAGSGSLSGGGSDSGGSASGGGSVSGGALAGGGSTPGRDSTEGDPVSGGASSGGGSAGGSVSGHESSTGVSSKGTSSSGALDDALAQIDALASEDRVRCIGETGLDHVHTPESGYAAQEESFRAHIEFAKKHGLAMQIHDREAHEDVVRVLRDAGAPERTVFHCFSGDPELARICNENGWYMSFAGTVTFKNAKSLKAALLEADRSLILTETDAPFLTPHPFRGRPNAPYMVNYTVRGMADILSADLGELCETIWANSERVYGQF